MSQDNYPEVVSAGAFDSSIGKTVDLVIYEDGERIVVGEAALVLDSGTDIVVSARIDSDYVRTLVEPTPEFSMGKWAQHVEQISALDQPIQVPKDFRYSLAVLPSGGNVLVPDEGPADSVASREDQTERGHESPSV